MAARTLGTVARSNLWWTSAHTCYGEEEAKNLHKRLLSGPTVDIYVGAQRKHWTLHRNLLCHHSSYFETELQGHEVSRKGKDDSLELPDDDPRGFELLVKWLYQGTLEDISDFVEDERKYDYAVACHKLYMLCDKFDMISAKNLAMDQYRRGLHEAQLVPDAEEINEIYRASPARSPFRKLMTQIAARQIMDPGVEKDAESYRKCFEANPDFAVEMVNAIRYMSGGILFEDPTGGDECAYHDHSDGSGYHGKEKAKGKAKALANGVGPKTSASQHNHIPAPPAREQPPVELSAERRTPRKLDIRTDRSQTTPAARKASNLNFSGASAQSKDITKLNKASSQGDTDSTVSGARNIAPSPAKPKSRKPRPNGNDHTNHPPRQRRNSDTSSATVTTLNSSVLGKKRPASQALDARGKRNVNGIVKQLNGVTSKGDAEDDRPRRAPVKLRQAGLAAG